MDKYEKLLEEKIKNAETDLRIAQCRVVNSLDAFHCRIESARLKGEIESYRDALNEYRQFKNKENA